MNTDTKRATGGKPYQTYADYLTWPDGNRDELIDGKVYVREPPAPGPSHQAIVGEIYRQIANALANESCRVFVAPFDVRLPKNAEPEGEVDTVVQPDVFIIRDTAKIDGRGLVGAPDWIAEVLSPSTAKHDQIVKVPVYERAGVRELWLVHPTDRNVTLYRLDETRRYGRPILLALKGETQMTAVPGVSIDWDRVVARML